MAASQENKNCSIDQNIQDSASFKVSYERKLHEFYAGHAKSDNNMKKPWTSDRILEVIEHIKKSRVSTQKDSSDYYWSSKYDLMEISGEDILIYKKKSVDDPTVRIVAMNEYFDILTEVHKSVGHGGREKMMYCIKNKIHIPKKAIEIYIKSCAVCEMKRSLPRKGIVTKPIISPDFNSRGQVDLIDFQSAPDGEFKWLMNYQDHATKFLHLRPLKSKRAVEVAFKLLKIFLEIGAPSILQTDNGKEFTAHVVEELVQLWPECKIVHGGPRRPQTQGSVERSNQDIENMLRSWMMDNKSSNWSVGCYFVQYYKNSSFHRIIGRSPYRALFGSDPKTVLKGTNIPNSIQSFVETNLENIETAYVDINNIESVSIQNVSTNIDVAKTPIIKNLEMDDMGSREINIPKAASVQDIPASNNLKIIPDKQMEMVNVAFMEISPPEPPSDQNIPAISDRAITPAIQMGIGGVPSNNIDIFEAACANDIPVNNDTPANKIIAVETLNLAAPVSSNELICLVCGNETSGAHFCKLCSKPVHVICGLTDGEEGYGSQILCFLCQKEHDILNEREQTHKGTKRAAEKMIDETVKKLPVLDIGNSIFLNVPKFDRGPLDTKNITGKIIDMRNGVFKIGTTSGTIKNWFPRQDLQISAQPYNGVISETPISLRYAVTCQSMFGGQGFQKCSCKPAKNQCRTKRCACFKNNVLCTSKCHQSLSCVYK